MEGGGEEGEGGMDGACISWVVVVHEYRGTMLI